MADVEDDKGGVTTQSAADMGFGGGVDMGNVNVGGAFDAATDSGLGGGLGLTEARGDYGGWDLPGQVSKGEANAWGPSFGTMSKSGAVAGTVLGALAGVPALGLLGAYAPGAINSIMGRGGTPGLPDIGGNPSGSIPGPDAANSIGAVGAGGAGGLLGLGNDKSQADALAALYTLLRQGGRAQ